MSEKRAPAAWFHAADYTKLLKQSEFMEIPVIEREGESIDDPGSDVKKGFDAGIPAPKPDIDSLECDTVLSRSDSPRDTLKGHFLGVDASSSANPEG